jgi:SAM-dependent methyltransferase
VSRARYDAIADTYGARIDDYTAPPTVALLELLGPVSGQRVLDLACGHGTISRYLARGGAQVVGIDLSSRLLAAARRREESEPLGVIYVQADAGAPDLQTGGRFDAVACHFGLSDIDDLVAALDNVARVLRPGGRFVFCILHPCFPGAPEASSSWPSTASYFDEGWWIADGARSTIRNQVGAAHRTLSTYLNELVGAGLTIDRLAEPPPEETWVEGRPGSAALPLYLAVRALKGG